MCSQLYCGAGLVEETEAAQMEDLLERRAKHLYFRAPRPSAVPPQQLAHRHPALAALPHPAFRAVLKVRC